ncbi:MAG: DUF3108 domain-containing protein [Candidatus Omnitrophota bacterium]
MRAVKRILFGAIVCTLIFGFSARGESYTLEKGEELTYKAQFLNIIPVGTVTITVGEMTKYEGAKVFPITCRGRSAQWIALLFKAETQLTATVDSTKIYPYRYEQVLRIAGKPDDLRLATYDRAHNIMEAQGKGRKKVPVDVRDPLSAIFFLRTQPLKDQFQVKQMINSNQSNYIFDAKVIGKKVINRVVCWVVDAKVRRENKSMYHSMDVTVYVSADERQVPVLIKAKTKIGPVALVLVAR